MKIDLSKAQADLDKIRTSKRDLAERITNLTESENQLVAFINLAQQYESTGTGKKLGRPPQRAAIEQRRPKAVAVKAAARFQPHKYPPQPIPEGYTSPNRRTELARKIIEVFEPNTIITAGTLVDKVGSPWPIPEGAKTAKHHLASIMIHETGPGAILDRVEPGHYRIKPNALEIVQSRVAAEIAQAQEEAARRAQH